MQKLEKIYEGKAKILYSTSDPDLLIQYFKDDATAFNGAKKQIIEGKGILNNLISEHLMNKLAIESVPCHLVRRLSDREQLIKKVEMVPLEMIIRNYSAGSMAKRLGLEEGILLSSPIIELCWKNDALGDPLINDEHAIYVLDIVRFKQLETMKKLAHHVNYVLLEVFEKIDIKLVDFKVEFGKNYENEMILADEISPDSCRLWDKKTDKKLDKDRFRRDLGDVIEAYREVASRLQIKF